MNTPNTLSASNHESHAAAGTRDAVTPDQPHDVVVIGGGPGGTTAACLLAEAGYRVVLLEKDTHPRFHIGESLLPRNLEILDRLGVLADVGRQSVVKNGADFICDVRGDDENHDSESDDPAGGAVQTFRFDRALGDTPGFAYEVRRADFDQLLFNNCREKGVDTREQARVLKIEALDDTLHRVIYVDDSQPNNTTHQSLVTRFVIDASGRDSLLAKKNQWQNKNPKHASAAIFGHFNNVPRRHGDNAGNISIYWFEHGWIWMIPLSDETMSIGAVCWPDYLKSRTTDTETFLRDTLAQSPAARERTRHATAVSPVRVTGNYSYKSSTLYGEGFLLVGDAYAFIDPVFSSGVYLSMRSAERAIEPVTAWLSGNKRQYNRLCRRYKRECDREISAFSWFIYRFTTPTMRELFRNPRNDWQVEQAVIAMLAGNGSGSPAIRRRILLFKAIYHGYRLKRLGQSFIAWRRRRSNARVKFDDEQIITTR